MVTESKVRVYFWILLAFIVAAFTLMAFGYRAQQHEVLRNKTQVAFLCKTSGSLALVLQQAADQTQASLNDGTYDRLLRQGVLTKHDIALARQSVARYRAQVAALRSPDSPCN